MKVREGETVDVARSLRSQQPGVGPAETKPPTSVSGTQAHEPQQLPLGKHSWEATNRSRSSTNSGMLIQATGVPVASSQHQKCTPVPALYQLEFSVIKMLLDRCIARFN